MSEKINKSFLTIEAKDDINEMLGRNEGSGSSSFTTQLETSEGLTIGKGTADEVSVTAAELEGLKNPTQLETSGGLTLGKGTEDETSLMAAELKNIKSIKSYDTIKISVTNKTLYPSPIPNATAAYFDYRIFTDDFSSDGLLTEGDYIIIGLTHDYESTNGFLYITPVKLLNVSGEYIKVTLTALCYAKKALNNVTVDNITFLVIKKES